MFIIYYRFFKIEEERTVLKVHFKKS